MMGQGCPWEEPSGSAESEEEVQGCVDVVVPDAVGGSTGNRSWW